MPAEICVGDSGIKGGSSAPCFIVEHKPPNWALHTGRTSTGHYKEPHSNQKCMRSVQCGHYWIQIPAQYPPKFLCVYLLFPCESLPSLQTGQHSWIRPSTQLQLFWLQHTVSILLTIRTSFNLCLISSRRLDASFCLSIYCVHNLANINSFSR